MIVPYKHLTSYAHAPVKANREDAGYDLKASRDIVVPSSEHVTITTELAIRIPAGYMGMIVSRSGLAAKHGVFVLNAPGIIDSNYSGEIKIVLANLGKHSYAVERGDKVAQLLIIPFPYVTLSRNDSMVWSGTRGDKGFGSSGY